MYIDNKFVPSGVGDRKRWGQTNSTTLASSIAQCLQSDKKSKDDPKGSFWLVVTASTADAYKLQDEIQFFAPDLKDHITLFPDWEILPYDSFSPHEDIISERLGTLERLSSQTCGALIVAIPTLCHRLPPRSFIQGHSLQIATGDKTNIKSLRDKFSGAGYRSVENVYEHGEFAIRGALIDVFPMGMRTPIRIELFDDEVDTLRYFDPETQRSSTVVERIQLLPGHEFPSTDSSIRTFKAQWLEVFGPPHEECTIYSDLEAGLITSGIEYYIPLFFDEMSSLFDYLPTNVTVAMPQQTAELVTHFFQDTNTRYSEYNIDRRRPLLPPERLLLNQTEFLEKLKRLPAALFSKEPVEEKPGRINFLDLSSERYDVDFKASNPWQTLVDHIQIHSNQGIKTLIVAESAGRQEFLIEKLQPLCQTYELGQLRALHDWNQALTTEFNLGITVGRLSHGTRLDQLKIHLICESQLFKDHVAQQRRRKKSAHIDPDAIIQDLTELRLGAPVVHIDHGVGRYQGLQTLSVDDDEQEFCTLSYANDTKLYVPVSSLHCIARYSGGNEDTAPLHRLGHDRWSTERKKAAEKAKDVAAELLQIYSSRAAQSGFAYTFDQNAYDSFSAEFPFEPTPDQDSAFQAVINDMTRQQPMDRLICGDVGFGKTEVAMRAAFIAVHGGKQVAVLVPTTLLAQQHFESFRDRFANWPVTIEVISRFKTAKEQNAVLQRLTAGQIDILVGTHKLLQESVKFNDLGLIVVDEEHRFGVKHKEALKRMRANLDVMAMTATPIPRTLNMSLTGMRDISIIATPPSKRLAVKTFVKQSSDNIRKEAILRELLRGGQVFYLHNEIKTIFKTAQELETLVPEAKVIVAHGQMRERELEKVMSDFYHQRYNVLVCTTIIETGIDIPSANTIIIDRADHFGLAQLHQLRGRVGRSHHQAYAYLLAPPAKSMTKDAIKRLDAIQEADTLGAGFTLASHDLEIRGAGELLGDEQSGHIQTVGYSMFMDMLNRAIKAIKAGKTPNLDQPLDLTSEINLHVPATIPSSYIHDPQTRLILYKRVASATSSEELDDLKIEFVDRFGTLPPQFLNLIKVTELKLTAQAIGVKKIDFGEKGGRIEFTSPPKIEPTRIIKLIQSRPHEFKLRGSDTLGILRKIDTPLDRIAWIETLLNNLNDGKT